MHGQDAFVEHDIALLPVVGGLAWQQKQYNEKGRKKKETKKEKERKRRKMMVSQHQVRATCQTDNNT